LAACGTGVASDPDKKGHWARVTAKTVVGAMVTMPKPLTNAKTVMQAGLEDHIWTLAEFVETPTRW
jgi:hypothetical protein